MKTTDAIGRITIGAIGVWMVIECVLVSMATPLAARFMGAIPRAITIVSWAAIIAMAVSAICFLIWSYRAMGRAHRRDPTLTISPAWSVGWYFVPIAWFWKPYEAMREIWTANALDPNVARPAPLISWWWGAWVVRGILDPLLFVLPGMPFTLMAIVYWSSSFAGIVAAFLLVAIIHRIAAMEAGQVDPIVFD